MSVLNTHINPKQFGTISTQPQKIPFSEALYSGDSRALYKWNNIIQDKYLQGKCILFPLESLTQAFMHADHLQELVKINWRKQLPITDGRKAGVVIFDCNRFAKGFIYHGKFASFIFNHSLFN